MITAKLTVINNDNTWQDMGNVDVPIYEIINREQSVAESVMNDIVMVINSFASDRPDVQNAQLDLLVHENGSKIGIMMSIASDHNV